MQNLWKCEKVNFRLRLKGFPLLISFAFSPAAFATYTFNLFTYIFHSHSFFSSFSSCQDMIHFIIPKNIYLTSLNLLLSLSLLSFSLENIYLREISKWWDKSFNAIDIDAFFLILKFKKLFRKNFFSRKLESWIAKKGFDPKMKKKNSANESISFQKISLNKHRFPYHPLSSFFFRQPANRKIK